MKRDEFIENIDVLAQVAGASHDETVRKSAGVLMTLKATLLAGDVFCEPFFDQMQVINTNMAKAVEAAQHNQG